MAVPETLLRQRVKARVESEFTAEGFEVADDKLTRAAGKDGEAELAVYPETTNNDYARANVLEVRVVLQLYLAYTAEPDENIVVDPTVIEEHADRLRRAFAGPDGIGASRDFWFLVIERIEFPDDPTGNKSRLEAHFLAKCDNPALL